MLSPGQPVPRVLTIGGLDPCGGAGISADARTIQLLGGEALTVAACLTVQSRHGFERAVPTEPALLRQCLDAAHRDGPLDAIKTGLLGDAASVRVVADWLRTLAPRPPCVVDPVLGSTAPGFQGPADLVEAYRELWPLGPLVTPNLPELERLTEHDDPGELLDAGCAAVLLKGGHAGADPVVDRLLARGMDAAREFVRPRLERGPVHGTGCALASALATLLAGGAELEPACAGATSFVDRCLRATSDDGSGRPVPLRLS